MPERRHTADPGGVGLGIPFTHHFHAGGNQIVGEPAIGIFALPHQFAPASIAPYAQCFACKSSVIKCNVTLHSIMWHPASGPSLAWDNRQAGSAKKGDGGLEQLSAHRGRQRCQRRWRDGTSVTIERADQKTHVFTERQADVVSHLLVFDSPQCSESFRTLPKTFAEDRSRQLPFAALFGDRCWRFERQQGDGFFDPSFAQINFGQQLWNGQSIVVLQVRE